MNGKRDEIATFGLVTFRIRGFKGTLSEFSDSAPSFYFFFFILLYYFYFFISGVYYIITFFFTLLSVSN